MPSAAIDACCLIDLLATGHLEAILTAAGFDWYLPTAVAAEVQHIRQHDPAQAGQVLQVQVDLTPLTTAGVFHMCSPADQAEAGRFVHYAARFRSDGEAMCLAIAEMRGWVVATDDRKAIRVARQANVGVISCPELVKRWADTTTPAQATINQVLRDIQILAQFRPNPTMPEYQWWMDELTRTVP